MYKEMEIEEILTDLQNQLAIRAAELCSTVMARGGDGCSLGSSANYSVDQMSIREWNNSWKWHIEGSGPDGYWETSSTDDELNCPQKAFNSIQEALKDLHRYLLAMVSLEKSPTWGTQKAPLSGSTTVG